MIQKVEAYKTSDGVIFTDEKEARQHDAKVALGQLIDQQVPYSDAQEIVRLFLRDHGETVLQLLRRIYPDEG